MVFWKKEEFGRSNIELRAQELVQRSNIVDGGSQLRHRYKLYTTILRAGHSLKFWLLIVMRTTLCREKKVETCPIVYRQDWAANFELMYPI